MNTCFDGGLGDVGILTLKGPAGMNHQLGIHFLQTQVKLTENIKTWHRYLGTDVFFKDAVFQRLGLVEVTTIDDHMIVSDRGIAALQDKIFIQF